MKIATKVAALGLLASAALPTTANAAYLSLALTPTSVTIFGGDFEYGLTANGQNINRRRGGSDYTTSRDDTINFSGTLIDLGDSTALSRTFYILPAAGASYAISQLLVSNTASANRRYTITGTLKPVNNIPVPSGAQTVAPGGQINFNSIYASAVLSVSAVPEPRTWAMMLAGFGIMGVALRRRTKTMVRYS